tara:strand:- start:312502 stop:313353 length:852 start_codon:yes stop_codon:yes gene_type:complete
MKILGHRGCIMKNAPYQNSLEAFKQGIALGDGIETDACVSLDGDIFFIHEAKYADTKVEYALNEHLNDVSSLIVGTRRLDQLTTNEVKTLKLKDGSSIPSWDETVALFTNNSDKIFNIELKSAAIVQSLIPRLELAFLESKLAPEQVVISSFNHPSLIKVRQAFPNISIGALFVSNAQKPAPLFPWAAANTQAQYMPLNKASLTNSLLKEIKPQFVIAPHTELNDNQINLIKECQPQAKVIIWVFTEWPTFNMPEFTANTEKFKKDGLLDTIIVDNLESYERS